MTYAYLQHKVDTYIRRYVAENNFDYYFDCDDMGIFEEIFERNIEWSHLNVMFDRIFAIYGIKVGGHFKQFFTYSHFGSLLWFDYDVETVMNIKIHMDSGNGTSMYVNDSALRSSDLFLDPIKWLSEIPSALCVAEGIGIVAYINIHKYWLLSNICIVNGVVNDIFWKVIYEYLE